MCGASFAKIGTRQHARAPTLFATKAYCHMRIYSSAHIIYDLMCYITVITIIIAYSHTAVYDWKRAAAKLFGLLLIFGRAIILLLLRTNNNAERPNPENR